MATHTGRHGRHSGVHRPLGGEMTVHTVHSVRACVDVVGERDRLDSLRPGRRLRPGRYARVCVLSLNESQTQGRTARNQGGEQPLSACHADIEQGLIRRQAYTLRTRSPRDSGRKPSEGRDRYQTCQRIFLDALANAGCDRSSALRVLSIRPISGSARTLRTTLHSRSDPDRRTNIGRQAGLVHYDP